MPVLSNARHEAFAQALAKGETADAAYVSAGYKPNRHNAARLKTNEHISARIEEIVSAVSEKAEWTAAERVKALKEIFEASKLPDPRVAISAIAEVNKMQGSYAPTKQEHTSPDGSMTPKPGLDVSGLSTEALAEIMRAADAVKPE